VGNIATISQDTECHRNRHSAFFIDQDYSTLYHIDYRRDSRVGIRLPAGRPPRRGMHTNWRRVRRV